MSNLPTLQYTFHALENVIKGFTADWAEIDYLVLAVLRADHDGKAYFEIPENKRKEVVNKARNILIGEDTL